MHYQDPELDFVGAALDLQHDKRHC